jgi:hypothetical protein
MPYMFAELRREYPNIPAEKVDIAMVSGAMMDWKILRKVLAFLALIREVLDVNHKRWNYLCRPLIVDCCDSQS